MDVVVSFMLQALSQTGKKKGTAGEKTGWAPELV
jgi:hypothetical protein